MHSCSHNVFFLSSINYWPHNVFSCCTLNVHPSHIIFYRVISGERLAKPAVVSLCCGVARRVIDEFGLGVAETQARPLAEAVVSRLGRGISGEFVLLVFGIRRKLRSNKPGLCDLRSIGYN